MHENTCIVETCLCTRLQPSIVMVVVDDKTVVDAGGLCVFYRLHTMLINDYVGTYQIVCRSSRARFIVGLLLTIHIPVYRL